MEPTLEVELGRVRVRNKDKLYSFEKVYKATTGDIFYHRNRAKLNLLKS